MRIETKYYADDGTEFDNPHACREYEDKFNIPKREPLKDYILFFGALGGHMEYSPYREPTYAFVKLIPEADNPVYRLWAETLQEGLADAIEAYCIRGWYVKNDEDKWIPLKILQSSLQKQERAIQRIVKNHEELF
jgi:hypothetical protein